MLLNFVFWLILIKMRFLILFLKCYPLNQLNKDLVKLDGTLHLIKHLCHLKYGNRHQHNTSEMVQLFGLARNSPL